MQTTYLSFVSLTAFDSHHPTTAAGRVFSAFYLIFCTLIVATYTASMTLVLVEASEKVEEVDVSKFLSFPENKVACIQQVRKKKRQKAQITK